MAWVLHRRQPLREGPRRGLVQGCRSLALQRSMRALLVVDLEEGVELPLLSCQVAGRRLRGAVLESLVHPFVPAILSGLSRLDADRVNPQSDPPHGQPR